MTRMFNSNKTYKKSETNNNSGIYNVGEFYNDGSLDEHLLLLHQMMQQFQERGDNNFHNYEDILHTFENREAEANVKPSVRDQMLKPQKVEPIQHNSSDFQQRFPSWGDDRMYYSTRSSVTSQSFNGISTVTEIENDREGCMREKVTHELNGKKYILTKKKCPGMSEQSTETLINMTKEELPEFLKHWNN